MQERDISISREDTIRAVRVYKYSTAYLQWEGVRPVIYTPYTKQGTRMIEGHLWTGSWRFPPTMLGTEQGVKMDQGRWTGQQLDGTPNMVIYGRGSPG